MKKIFRNQDGISMIVLMITLILMAILMGTILRRVDIGTDIRNYNYMCADIELLEEKVNEYYISHGSLPTTTTTITRSGDPNVLHGQESSRDGDVYYLIDVSKLSNITLNYGGGGSVFSGDLDHYIVNQQSHEIYYLKGVELEGTIYHRKK